MFTWTFYEIFGEFSGNTLVESFKKIPAAEGTIEYRNKRDAVYLMLFGDDPTRVKKKLNLISIV